MSNQDIELVRESVKAGADVAAASIDAMNECGQPSGSALHFYVGLIGAHLGNIVAHVGKRNALDIIDLVRSEIERGQLDKKSAPVRH